MKKKVTSKLPSTFARKLLNNHSLDVDIRVTPDSRLLLKLLVFDSPAKLRRFWGALRPRRGRFGGLCKGTRGAVNGLRTEVIHGGKSWVEVDQRYFAVMGLVKGWLGIEVITHESVHAGFAYYTRTKGLLEWEGELEEEGVCYPSGIIAKKVVQALEVGGFYK